MRVVPKKYVPKIAFFNTVLSAWLEHAEQLGIPADQVALLQEQVDIARARYDAQQAAKAAAETATQAFHHAIEKMNTTGVSLLQQIRAHGSTSGHTVYDLAMIPAPAKKSPVGPPGTPARFTADLHPGGSVLLKWDCKNPSRAAGTTYHVSRKIISGPAAEPTFTLLGISGRKQFLDTTIPAGTAELIYEVRAIRSTAAGSTATHIVHFGTTNLARHRGPTFTPSRARRQLLNTAA